MRGRQSSPSAAPPKTRRSMTTPAGPASLKSVLANAAPICTETIAASTSAIGGAPRSSILMRALAMRLSVLIYGVTTVDIATSAGRKDDEPKGRTVKPTAKGVRTATVCRDEVRFRPEHQCLPERQVGIFNTGQRAQRRFGRNTYLYVAFRLFRDTNPRSGGCLREQRNGSSQRRPTSAGAPARAVRRGARDADVARPLLPARARLVDSPDVRQALRRAWCSEGLDDRAALQALRRLGGPGVLAVPDARLGRGRVARLTRPHDSLE